MNSIYFEAKGEELLERLGMSKAEFARRMGIQRQNVKALFKTRNLDIIRKASEVLQVPFELLVGYVDPIDFEEIPMVLPEICEVLPEDVPMGDSVEDRKLRRNLIKQFYIQWMSEHPEGKLYNRSLRDEIYVKYISLNETSAHASLNYLSTLAVLQLDAILQNAHFVKIMPSKPESKNQKGFKRIILMEYHLPGIGRIRLTVGVKGIDGTKVQYCITAIEPVENSKKQP